MSPANLAKKFIETWQLNVAERRSLIGIPLAGSLLVAEINNKLKLHGWYPTDWRPERGFDGGVVELLSEDSCRIHWMTEVGMSRFELVKVERFDSLVAGALAYGEKFFGATFDGIPIDWSK